MKVKIDPKKTALLVIDMQNDWILKEGAGAKHSLLWQEVEKGGIIKNIQRIVRMARDCTIPIFHVRTAWKKTTAMSQMLRQISLWNCRNVILASPRKTA